MRAALVYEVDLTNTNFFGDLGGGVYGGSATVGKPNEFYARPGVNFIATPFMQ